uniref:Uncharacterized protein n=1 Tax=Octopus bimaculoides TaxID=37653 RepID=A0A0L8FUL9_OCTBM
MVSFMCHPHKSQSRGTGNDLARKPYKASQAVLATVTLRLVHLMCHPHKSQSRGPGNDLTWLAGSSHAQHISKGLGQ